LEEALSLLLSSLPCQPPPVIYSVVALLIPQPPPVILDFLDFLTLLDFLEFLPLLDFLDLIEFFDLLDSFFNLAICQGDIYKLLEREVVFFPIMFIKYKIEIKIF
jgi:hypothetical protein